MDKVERFQNAYDYLYNRGAYHTKSELAKRLGRTRTNVSEAYYGRSPYFTDKFLLAFCREFPEINYEWIITGNGDMLNNKQQAQSSDDKNSSTIIDLAASLIKEVEGLRQQLTAEREALQEERRQLHDEIQNLHQLYTRLRVVSYSDTPTVHLLAAEPKTNKKNE